ncbi:MAG: hypothetical protein KF836_02140 [Fimbriimonadaceae bacterium]|nr:hypothetical protein [Fimbriimonadaceae bacterium]
MTGRERLLALAADKPADRRASIATDCQIVPVDRVSQALKEKPDLLTLALVHSPLSRALQSNIPIYDLIQADPIKGNEKLDELCLATQARAVDALGQGADGICYLIEGASPTHSTPMQYGGHFLERDREILESLGGAKFNLLVIAGSEEPYIDFVSDLQADAFAWDSDSNWTPAQVRELRSGALAADHAEADIDFPVGNLQALAQIQEAKA